MDIDKWERMREDLMALTMRQLRAIAKAEGICLGYAASRKDSTVAQIVTWRRHLEREGRVPKGRDWHENGVTAMGGIKKGWS